jgi:RHS repeat-associated protein
MSNTARRTSLTYPNGRVVNLGYGSTGSVDDLFSLVKSAAISGESSNKVEYTRAGLGRYVKISYPQPGVEMSMIRPGGGSEGDSGDPYDGYDRFSRVQEMRWQNSSTGTSIDAWQWGYNEASNRTWKKNLVAAGGQDEAYGYDGLYQVIRDSVGTLNTNRTAIGGIPGEEEDFTYDPTGNWLGYRKDTNGTAVLKQSRSNNKDNQLTQIDGSSALLSYDRAGNATKTAPGMNGDWSKYYQPVWDAWNRLVEVRDESGTTVQKNTYDGLTRRITKETGGTVTHTYWSDRWKPLEERIGSATTAARSYLWGERPGHRDELILRDRDTDGNGTLDERLYATMDYFNGTAVMNTSGTVLERYAYSAFGIRRIMAADFTRRSTSSYTWDFGFQGQFRDSETGWYNYGYRFYVPLLGRWINRDPIGVRGGVNLYGFTMNKSINRNDRYGLWTCEPCADQCNQCFPNPGDKEDCLADCRNEKLSMNCSSDGDNDGGSEEWNFGFEDYSSWSDCYSECINHYRDPIANAIGNLFVESANWGLSHVGNAGLNAAVGPTRRPGGNLGIGGTKPHATSWQHKLGSRIGPWGSRVGRFAGRAAVVTTVADGFWDIGLFIGCAYACSES